MSTCVIRLNSLKIRAHSAQRENFSVTLPYVGIQNTQVPCSNFLIENLDTITISNADSKILLLITRWGLVEMQCNKFTTGRRRELST